MIIPKMIQWISLEQIDTINQIKEVSFKNPQIIYKHSSRCSISFLALKKLEKVTPPASASFYFLDIIKHRAISNYVSEAFQVHHESPQILLIKHGECVYEESHMGISMDEIINQLTQ